MLPAPLLLALAWLVLWGVLDGLGRLTSTLLRGGETLERPLARAWLGFATLLALLLPWHLVRPVDGVTWLPAVALALVGHARTSTHRQLWPALGALARRPVFTLAAAAAVTLTAVLACGAPSHPDDYLYFLQTVTLSGRFPAVPGIGHVHHRLAFNHAHHLYVAFCDVGPFDGGGFHVANGVPYLSVLLASLDAFTRTARVTLRLRADGPPLVPPVAIDAATLFAATLLPIALYRSRGHVASASADGVVFAFGAALALLAIALLSRPPRAGNGLQGPLGAFWWLAAAAVATKPSLVLAAAPVLAAVLWHARRDLRHPTAFIAPVAATLLLLVPWVAHGVVLSGYPLFPSPLWPFDVDWRLPESIVAAERAYVAQWGRSSLGSGLESGPWLLRWATRAWLFNLELLAPAVLVVVSLVWLAWQRRRGATDARTGWPLALASIGGVVAWIASSPDPRHAGIVPWMLAASWFAVAASRKDGPSDGVRSAVVGLGLAAILLDAPPSGLPAWRTTLLPAETPRTTAYEAGPGTILQLEAEAKCVAFDCAVTRVRAQFRVPGVFERGFRRPE